MSRNLVGRSRIAARATGRYLIKNWPFVALAVFIVLPLYWMAGYLAFRAGMFGFTHSTLSEDEQVKMFLTFIGGGLATAATVLGTLLTRRYREREAWRQNCEAVNAGLQSLNPGKSRVAGVLTNTVELGKPEIAVRILDPAWRTDDLDAATATWIIDQVLLKAAGKPRERPSPATLHEVAVILAKHAQNGDLTEEKQPRHFSIPDSLREAWKVDPAIPLDVQSLLLTATAHVLLSREWQWWCDDPKIPPRWPHNLWLSCVTAAHESAQDAPSGKPSLGMEAAVLLSGLYARQIASRELGGTRTSTWEVYWDAKSRYNDKLGEYLELARQISEKWEQGDIWREVFGEPGTEAEAQECARRSLKPSA